MSTVTLLTNNQLRELGVSSVGEIAMLRAACNLAFQRSNCLKGPGRPPLDINVENMELMREAEFTWDEISQALLVSRTTLWRRLKQSGYDFRTYTDISDHELESVLNDLHRRYPHTGLIIMCGHLESLGIRVQRRGIKEMLQRIDPIGRSQRWHSVVRRRAYNVPGPNSLWHIDGHHSLIRWRFVIHGGIDGYSRLIVLSHASANNRANKVFNLFWKATKVFGVPSRVCSDKGGENIDVCYFMIMHRGAGRRSHTAGCSTHNQRIERLWRDLYRCVCSLFHSLFYYMEAIGVLDPTNSCDVFVLHYIFLPRINLTLSEFALAWNLHPMRTMHNWSPKKVFLSGIVDDFSASGIRDVVDDIPLESLDLFGVDYFSEQSSVEYVDSVVVPCTPSPLPPELFQDYMDSLDPLEQSDDYGVGVYTRAKETLSRILGSL